MYGTPTNQTRAENARIALEAFIATGGQDDDLRTAIKDLITNLCHLARRETGLKDAVEFAKGAALMHDIEVEEDDEA